MVLPKTCKLLSHTGQLSVIEVGLELVSLQADVDFVVPVQVLQDRCDGRVRDHIALGGINEW